MRLQRAQRRRISLMAARCWAWRAKRMSSLLKSFTATGFELPGVCVGIEVLVLFVNLKGVTNSDSQGTNPKQSAMKGAETEQKAIESRSERADISQMPNISGCQARPLSSLWGFGQVSEPTRTSCQTPKGRAAEKHKRDKRRTADSTLRDEISQGTPPSLAVNMEGRQVGKI